MKIEKWKLTRDKGKKYFVLVHGVLGWGVVTAVMWSVIMQAVDPIESFWLRTLLALIFFPLGGLGFGVLMWDLNEKKYQKFLGDKDKQ